MIAQLEGEKVNLEVKAAEAEELKEGTFHQHRSHKIIHAHE